MLKIFYGFDQVLTLKPSKNFDVGLIEKGAVAVENGKISFVGKEKDIFSNPYFKKAKKIKLKGTAIPSFVDSHTHAVFAEARLKDFSLRTSGHTYKEIKEKGGGIISSVTALRRASAEDLKEKLLFWSKKFLENGTATAEIKSGYGLDNKNEIKILKTIKETSKETCLEMVPTFLGAHSIPPEFKNSKDYLDYLIKKVLPQIKKNKLAVFADIFCEEGYFSPQESEYYLKECLKAGLKPKIHAEQLKNYGGAGAAAAVNAVSADHMDYANLSDLKALAQSKTIVTFLPASNYFLGLSHFPDARPFIEKGVKVALATDFNPGTSPCFNMQFVISCAVTHMKMTVEQALFSSCLNGAAALGLENKIGSLEKGKQADISVFEVKDYREIAYYFGSNLNIATVKKGNIIYEKNNTVRC
ncbi:MAG: imidazolonepropionase [Elusimicrobia bacterium]|nr:imidazolonepropionase [Elusimicrobiota bacterium]